jgi:hypothetical protein
MARDFSEVPVVAFVSPALVDALCCLGGAVDPISSARAAALEDFGTSLIEVSCFTGFGVYGTEGAAFTSGAPGFPGKIVEGCLSAVGVAVFVAFDEALSGCLIAESVMAAAFDEPVSDMVKVGKYMCVGG